MKMKKIIALILSLGFALSGAAALADDGQIGVYIDGKPLTFDVAPILERDRVLVPFRAIFAALGAEVDWEQSTQTAIAKRGGDIMKITIDNNIFYKNDVPITLDVPARVLNDRTLVPIRAVSEGFGADVKWDGEAQRVIIATKAENTASPSPEATLTPENVSQGSKDGSTGDRAKLPFTELSEKDMQELISEKDDIRYNFEQEYLPDFVFRDKSIYENVKSEVVFKDIVKQLWTMNAMDCILDIQIGSDNTDYILNPDKLDEKILQESYEKLISGAGMDYESVFAGVASTESENGTAVAVIEFKTADGFVDCKCIGIAASKEGNARYFTLENDAMQKDTLFFCEVKEGERGTISTFDKRNDDTDIKTFVAEIIKAYENGSSVSASLKFE
jgi:hypothetical protein